jgi:ubiquinone biosynthesis accessory factor UbiK
MPKFSFQTLVEQLSSFIPEQLGTFKKDFEKNCHLLLTKTFDQFDLVNREEFETQTKVLLRTRKKVEALEQKIKQLEAHLKDPSDLHE